MTIPHTPTTAALAKQTYGSAAFPHTRQPSAYHAKFSRYSGSSTMPGQLIVKLRTGLNPSVLTSFSQRYRVRVLKTSPLGAVLIQNQAKTETQQLIQYLKQDSTIEYAEPNRIYRNHFTVNDPRSVDQKGLARIGIAKAWDMTMGDPQVIIAIVDTGIDLEHPDLKSQLVTGYNALSPESQPKDENGHGTHAAGIAAAATDNKEGIAGTAPRCKIMPVRALDAQGGGNGMDVGMGILWAVDHGAQIINLSLGVDQPDETVKRAVQYALRNNVTVVAAAGNESVDTPNYPAAFPGVISVGSIDINQQLSDFSNYGNWISVVAPGSQILSTMPTYSTFLSQMEGYKNHYDFMDGTSMASPMVAGVVALMKSRYPQLSPSEVKARLEGTATDLGRPGFDEQYGHGLVQAVRAIQ